MVRRKVVYTVSRECISTSSASKVLLSTINLPENSSNVGHFSSPTPLSQLSFPHFTQRRQSSHQSWVLLHCTFRSVQSSVIRTRGPTLREWFSPERGSCKSKARNTEGGNILFHSSFKLKAIYVSYHLRIRFQKWIEG